MKKFLVLLALLALVACVPEPTEPKTFKELHEEPEEQAVEPVSERVIPPAYTKVWQTRGDERILWGFDQKGNLMLLNSTTKSIVLTYDDYNKIIEIDDGIKPSKFFYDNKGKLLSVEKGIERWILGYSSTGRLVRFDTREKWRFLYNSKGRLSRVSRGSTNIDFTYDPERNRTKSMFFGQLETQMAYDRDGRLKLMQRGGDHLVLAYWREDLLSSLSGTMYGLKETVNYGPTAITLISNIEQNNFESQYPEDREARFSAFNTFLFCSRLRKLPVLFDGKSWVLFREYFKGSIDEYLLKTFVCGVLP